MNFSLIRKLLSLILLTVSMSITSLLWADQPGQWTTIFNGEDLTGWTPKIRFHELGENYGDTFQVQDGLLTVSYEGYKNFNNTFGHLFYHLPYSHYRFRMQYRFVGEQMHDGANWALRNSGIMVHSQNPSSMTREQEFPVSIEVQLLGGDGKRERSTANMCSPGTHIEWKGKLEKRHCINSSSSTYTGEQWVSVEVEVLGNESIKHFINGELVMSYKKPQLDVTDKSVKPLLSAMDGETSLGRGYISLQSESHPVQFKNIAIKALPGNMSAGY